MSFRDKIKQLQFGMPVSAPKTVKNTTSIETHLQNAIASHKGKQHGDAKKHALKAVNALHALTGSASAPGTDPC